MDHGGHDKGEGVLAGGERVPLLDEDGAGINVKVEVLADHDLNLGVADHLDLGIAQDELAKGRGVVRLHVVHDHIVQLAAGQDVLDVLKEHAAYGLVHRVQKHGLFVQNDVRIVGNAARDGKDVLKQREPAVVAAYPKNIVFDIFYAIHDIPLLGLIRLYYTRSFPKRNEGMVKCAPPGPYSGKWKYALALL